MKSVSVNVKQNQLRHSYEHRKKEKKSKEFKELLDSYLTEKEEAEEFRVLLPRHGHFWDNGYEDVG